jgi:hypothetical protein
MYCHVFFHSRYQLITCVRIGVLILMQFCQSTPIENALQICSVLSLAVTFNAQDHSHRIRRGRRGRRHEEVNRDDNEKKKTRKPYEVGKSRQPSHQGRIFLPPPPPSDFRHHRDSPSQRPPAQRLPVVRPRACAASSSPWPAGRAGALPERALAPRNTNGTQSQPVWFRQPSARVV